MVSFRAQRLSTNAADFIVRYVKTTIITGSLGEAVEKSGAGFASLEDTGEALLRIVSDSSVHGECVDHTNRKSS